MYGRSGFSSCSDPKIDFNEVFSKDTLTAEELLGMPNIVDEVRLSSESFSSLIKARPDLVKQFADYALRPELVQNLTGSFPVTYPFMCMEILCCQTEQFLDFVLQPLPKLEQTNTVADPEAESSIFKHMLLFLKSNQRLNETAAGYLLRFISQLQYQRGSELFHFFEEQAEIFERFIAHSYSKSISQVFSKLLSVDSEETTPKKLVLINHIIKSLTKETRDRQLGEKLENLVYMFTDLMEKCQERYDGARYTTLFASAISVQNCSVLAQILLSKCQIQDILLPGLDIFAIFLNFYKTDKAKRAHKPSEDQNSMVAEEIDEQGNMNNDVLLKIEGFANNLLQKFQGHQLNIDWTKQSDSLVGSSPKDTIQQTENHIELSAKKPENTQNKENKQEGINSVSNAKSEKQQSMLLEDEPIKPKFRFSQLKLFALVQDLIILEPKKSSFQEDLLTAAFVRYAMKLMKDHPNNNLMHNTLKNILVKGIKGKSSTAQVICSKNSGLVQFILYKGINKSKNQESYMNQLYHIATAIEQVRLKDPQLSENISKEYPQWNNYIANAYTQRRKTYNRLLGDEDPKKKSDICMFGFYSRPVKTTGVRVEVEEVKPYNFEGKGELGDDDDIMGQDIGLQIESDDDKHKKPSRTKKQAGSTLCSLLNKEEVTSQDQDTVRIEDDIPNIPNIPMKMEIEDEPHRVQQGKTEKADERIQQQVPQHIPEIVTESVPNQIPEPNPQPESTTQVEQLHQPKKQEQPEVKNEQPSETDNLSKQEL